jgi:hypothetical protein
MIAIKKNELCICIPCTQPDQHREEIIKALAATIRWRASYPELHKGDEYNLYILSMLLEQLTTSE